MSKINTMEIQIQQDKAFLNALYQCYDYLQDFPSEFKGMLLDEAVSLGMLQTDGFLGTLLGYLVQNESLAPNHFPYLPTEVNQAIAHYRHLTPVQPWPQPIIGVAMAGDSGRVTGIHSVPVILQKVGNAQIWYGGDVGFIFEALLGRSLQSSGDFESLINQLWTLVEQYLQAQGVTRIYTLARDPEFDEDWLKGHLGRRGYQPVLDGSVVWVKA